MLSQGTKLGPYEVIAQLGAGGMGEVYRARDTKLGRDVALKVLPQAFAADGERMARFQREAQVLASLNHPNIAAIYGLEESGGVRALALELVEGPTLAERLKSSAIPLDEALLIAREIAEALEYAHEKGIIHRDLKPANIKLDKEHRVKVLDFGLAKALDTEGSVSNISNSPTLTAAATQAGMILGTAAYMSPEQAKGKPVDRRGDIWAFGCVLYEMLTGKRVFEGEAVSDTLAAVLKTEPDWEALSRAFLPRIRDLLHRCLRKDPRARLQSIGDARIAIEEALSGAPEISAEASLPRQAGAAKARTPNRTMLALAAACVALIAALVSSILFLSQPSPSTVEVRASILAPEKTDFQLMDDDAAGPVVISPDGMNIAFTGRDEKGRSRIWVRALSGGENRPLSGTEEGTYPFWSPDGRWLGFFADGKLRKVPIGTGPVLELADAPRARGGSWGTSNVILFAPTPASPILAVSAAGGPVKPVTTVRTEMHTTHRWPLWLPDGKRFLYLATSHGNPLANERNGIYLGSLDGKEDRMLLPSESNVAVAPGYLLYVQSGVLVAQPFDEQRGELKGDPTPVTQSVIRNPATWRAAFDTSTNGVLVYQSGGSGKPSELLWLAPGNKAPTKVVGSDDSYRALQLSPDGRRLAVVIGSPHSDLWIYDLARDIKTHFTFTSAPFVITSTWAPDGTRIAFSEVGTSGTNIYVKEAGGSGNQEVLVSSGKTNLNTVDDWSKDGKYLLYHAVMASSTASLPLSLYVLPMTGDRKSRLFLSAAPCPILEGHFSPDVKWVAYLSIESGGIEAYVTSFPDANGKWQISGEGGTSVRWFPNGQALLYQRMDGTFVKVPFAAHGKDAEIGAPQTYVSARPFPSAYGESWDIAPDGRVIVNTFLGGGTTQTIDVIVNWTAGLKK